MWEVCWVAERNHTSHPCHTPKLFCTDFSVMINPALYIYVQGERTALVVTQGFPVSVYVCGCVIHCPPRPPCVDGGGKGKAEGR